MPPRSRIRYLPHVLRLTLWIAALGLLSTVPGQQATPPASQGGPEELAGHPLGGRLWVHLDTPTRYRQKFRMYQFNPTGSDGRGTGWYHEGDFTEWMTEALHYQIRGNELALTFDLSGEQANLNFDLTKARGPGGADLKLTMLPDPRRYWRPYEYYASSRGHQSILECLIAQPR